MFKVLLFDLDGTLIEVDMRIFVKEYFQKLGLHLSPVISPQELKEHLGYATHQMILNQDPAKTNKEVFWEVFLERVEKPLDLLEPLIDKFYRHKFKELKAFTSCKPEARKVVGMAASLNFDLVLATNPVFPSSAIYQRMNWGGVDSFDYKLVTTYENMHFCKPNPQYYLEILDKVGARPQDCIMIGNDVDDDLCAAQVGIKTYLVEDFLINRSKRSIDADYRGSLKDLPEFLEKIAPNNRGS
ncbi:HAD family hydrolase [Candidatus Contubernalis alkaliaceticus]|uniref:HAD family hydrolase n=1 Tax=Candidatus Contubernalis alkaliaceticus TaxID=338645 RepID=UPI001F4C2661|nr:HAD family hydrolase [Candidatus Contubernalis alkalaceticus]UNC93441.1 HAD family hydrolase [Candidatus Contubernalis alkalaceticus]